MTKTKFTKKTNAKKTPSKKARLIAYLRTGKSVSYQLAETRFKLGNLRATVSDINKETDMTIVPIKTKNGTKYAKV